MAEFEIEIQADAPLPEGVETALWATAVAVLTHEEIAPPAALTILLTDDDALQRLNRDFRGYDTPTDVLSFPTGAATPGMAEAGLPPYLGDLAISVSRAAAQATAGGHSLTAELQLLTVHGVLHLLGYDHADEGEKEAMWAAQAAVLTQLGAEITGPHE
jgi:probable rRNA maturation factor